MQVIARKYALTLLLILIFTPFTAQAGVKVSVGKFNNNSPKMEELEKFDDALTNAIVDELSSIAGLDVAVSGSAMLDNEKKIGSLAGDKSVSIQPDNAKYMVSGDFKAKRKKVKVNVKLLNLETADVIASEKVSGKISDLEAVKKEVASKAVELVKANVPMTAASADDEKAAMDDEAEADEPPPLKGPQTVKVKGYGSAPIKGPPTMYKKVALMLAQRDAVERAIGSVVHVEAVPEDEYRKVVATTSGHVSQKVAHRGEEGGLYVIEIDAEVTVPEDIINKYPLSAIPEQEVTGYKPLIEHTPFGEINWRDGYLIANGKGKPDSNPEMAKRAAVVDARARAMEMIAGLRYDPDSAAGDVTEKDDKLSYKVFGLVQGAEVIKQDKAPDGGYKVTLKVPLRGIRGLTATLTDSRAKGTPPDEPPALPDEEEESDEDSYTGLVIDARNTGATPAFFPEIVDEDGNVVFNVDMVDPDALKKRGMAAYVTGDEEEVPEDLEDKSGSLIGPNPMYVEAVPVLQVASIGADFLWFKLPQPFDDLIAKAKKKRKLRKRQGKKPGKIKATNSKGKKKARIVVSRKAGRKIARLNKKTKIVKRARIVVITDSMIGGTEGRRFIYEIAVK